MTTLQYLRAWHDKHPYYAASTYLVGGRQIAVGYRAGPFDMTPLRRRSKLCRTSS